MEGFYEELSQEQSNVKLFYVTEQEIEKIDLLLPDRIEMTRGTMKIHQIVTAIPGQITWRVLSCWCSTPHL